MVCAYILVYDKEVVLIIDVERSKEPNNTRLFIVSLRGMRVVALDPGEKGAPLHYPL